MSRRRHVFILAAIALLLAAGTDLLIVDVFSSVRCDGSEPGSSEQLPDDECFCCCAHIVMPVPPVAVPEQALELVQFIAEPDLLKPEPAHVYHPPRI